MIYRIIMYRSDTRRWFVYRERFTTEAYAKAHGRRMLMFQPSWDYKVVDDGAAHALVALLNG